ncbi:MAG: hypothetical protein JSS02_06130 [Planctomycetes bacterium]|nr:hypothetical protein [Planctomycetota bacterium]
MLSESQNVWSPGWTDRIHTSVRSLGFADLTQLLDSMPAAPYSEVAHHLGKFAPIQIVAVQFKEARLANRVRDAAKDSLSRNLNEQLPGGWGSGNNADFKQASALANWFSELTVTGECGIFKDVANEILEHFDAPFGWKPNGPNDPVIEKAFNQWWMHKIPQ